MRAKAAVPATSKYMIRKCITISWRAAKGMKKEGKWEPKDAKRGPKWSHKGATMKKTPPTAPFAEKERTNLEKNAKRVPQIEQQSF